MARQTEFVRFVLDLLSSIGDVRARAMFGGFGVYQREIMFAIIVDDRLYLKTNAATSRKFAAVGSIPFTYVARGKTIALQYYEAPPDAFESSEVMRGYAREAIEVALRAGKRRKA